MPCVKPWEGQHRKNTDKADIHMTEPHHHLSGLTAHRPHWTVFVSLDNSWNRREGSSVIIECPGGSTQRRCLVPGGGWGGPGTDPWEGGPQVPAKSAGNCLEVVFRQSDFWGSPPTQGVRGGGRPHWDEWGRLNIFLKRNLAPFATAGGNTPKEFACGPQNRKMSSGSGKMKLRIRYTIERKEKMCGTFFGKIKWVFKTKHHSFIIANNFFGKKDRLKLVKYGCSTEGFSMSA